MWTATHERRHGIYWKIAKKQKTKTKSTRKPPSKKWYWRRYCGTPFKNYDPSLFNKVAKISRNCFSPQFFEINANNSTKSRRTEASYSSHCTSKFIYISDSHAQVKSRALWILLIVKYGTNTHSKPLPYMYMYVRCIVYTCNWALNWQLDGVKKIWISKIISVDEINCNSFTTRLLHKWMIQFEWRKKKFNKINNNYLFGRKFTHIEFEDLTTFNSARAAIVSRKYNKNSLSFVELNHARIFYNHKNHNQSPNNKLNGSNVEYWINPFFSYFIISAHSIEHAQKKIWKICFRPHFTRSLAHSCLKRTQFCSRWLLLFVSCCLSNRTTYSIFSFVALTLLFVNIFYIYIWCHSLYVCICACALCVCMYEDEIVRTLEYVSI